LREEAAAVLAGQDGEWEVRVQLCRDLEQNPIEDGSAVWPEADNPYVAVATIRVPSQPGWTREWAGVLDDETAFSPWHALAAHCSLGGIMRARRPAYASSTELRARLTAVRSAGPGTGRNSPASRGGTGAGHPRSH
jgi:hypothetical protein